MPVCNLDNIRAIFHFPEAYEVDTHGNNTNMVERPAYYAVPWNAISPFFTEYYCTVHGCTFKHWKAVATHIKLGKVNT